MKLLSGASLINDAMETPDYSVAVANCKRSFFNKLDFWKDNGHSSVVNRSILDAHKLTDPNLAVCFHCNKLGHWKRNCKVYLAELKKRKGSKTTASDSGMFMIEVNMSLGQISTWVLDTACGSHICNSLRGLKGSRNLEKDEGIGAYRDAVKFKDLRGCKFRFEYEPWNRNWNWNRIRRGQRTMKCIRKSKRVQVMEEINIFVIAEASGVIHKEVSYEGQLGGGKGHYKEQWNNLVSEAISFMEVAGVVLKEYTFSSISNLTNMG
ncbi:hypothetical protein AgCh_028132 [Apium graveolens]